MDYIKRFDIELDKEIYYAGELLTGHVVVENIENIKVQGIRVFLRGKAHTEWRVTRAGERRTVKEDEYYVDEKKLIWGKDKNEEGPTPILPRGAHRLRIQFALPETALPCSFESKVGRIRYYLRVILDIPYASPPQGIKYFTIAGPHIDCMDERYLAPAKGEDKKSVCCLCCTRRSICMNALLERSAYCCGERLKLKAEVQNGSNENVWLVCRLMQYVEYFINKGVLGLSKDLAHKIWEYQSETVTPHKTVNFDELQNYLQVPVLPPTLLNVSTLIRVYYVLKIVLCMEKSGEDLEIDLPVTIATVPFRIPNTPPPKMQFDVAVENAEGGIYISPEFLLGQVYMGENDESDDTILYRPVYPCVPHEKITVTNTNNAVKHTKKYRLPGRSRQKLNESEVSHTENETTQVDSPAPDDRSTTMTPVSSEQKPMLQTSVLPKTVERITNVVTTVKHETSECRKVFSSSMSSSSKTKQEMMKHEVLTTQGEDLPLLEGETSKHSIEMTVISSKDVWIDKPKPTNVNSTHNSSEKLDSRVINTSAPGSDSQSTNSGNMTYVDKITTLQQQDVSHVNSDAEQGRGDVSETQHSIIMVSGSGVGDFEQGDNRMTAV